MRRLGFSVRRRFKHGGVCSPQRKTMMSLFRDLQQSIFKLSISSIGDRKVVRCVPLRSLIYGPVPPCNQSITSRYDQSKMKASYATRYVQPTHTCLTHPPDIDQLKRHHELKPKTPQRINLFSYAAFLVCLLLCYILLNNSPQSTSGTSHRLRQSHCLSHRVRLPPHQFIIWYANRYEWTYNIA